MKITFKKGTLESAPADYARIMLTDRPKGERRIVREKGIETIEVGIGNPAELNQRRFILLCRSIVVAAKAHKAKRIALHFDRTADLFKNLSGMTPERMTELAAENFVMAHFDFTALKTKPKEGWPTVEEIALYGKSSASIEAAARKGQLIGEAVNACRTLANTPGGDMTPSILARAAKAASKSLPVKVTTFGAKEMRKIGMGALLGVAKGSSEPPTFTVMEYAGTGKTKERPVVLVGKGVTFDSGGLNIKSASSMYEMHLDMSGAAAALHAVVLAARLKLPRPVVALLPAVENMPGNQAYRPGDVLKSLSGKTIEVTNTDAEGRLILADALTYAKRYAPAAVIDIATLTGAAASALGLYASALLSRDESLAASLVRAGEESGDYLWPLPLWDEYEDAIRGTFADITNSAMGACARYGGAIEGGMFLWQFAKELSCPWAHIDMAPRMTSAPGDCLAKGAAGAPVRALIRFIETWKP